MGRTRGHPLLVGSSNAMVPLERVRLGFGCHSEAWLQALIHEQPGLLPVAQIEPGLGELIPVAREVPCGHGYIDNLYLTGDGEIVLVEAKLWANPQARREVVAQALDYVAALAQLTYEAFEHAVAKAKGGYASLYTCVAATPDALPEAEFVDAVSRNLRMGRILVLVVGDGIHRQAKALAGLLQSHAGAHFTFALVELATWRDPGSGAMLVVPDVLAQTVMIERGIVRLQGGGMEVLPVPVEAAAGPVTMTQEMFFEDMGRVQPSLGRHVRDFIALIEPLGIRAEFKSSLNLKADLPNRAKPTNFGSISKQAKLRTDVLSWSEPGNIAMTYNARLADHIGGRVAVRDSGQCYLSPDGQSFPRVDLLLPGHAEAWAAAIAGAIDEIRMSESRDD
ncbi:MAG: hypothetical protein EOP21_03545 [Hyphomicrobiales bacterium]|nr:MAG: hypothetical protein EOP21_03545 [Hyphomicrobiales bacterium]